MLWQVRLKVGAVVGTAMHPADPLQLYQSSERNGVMNRIIWLVGAVVIVLFVLGYFGLR
jgi:type VI protein secretion system component VasF